MKRLGGLFLVAAPTQPHEKTLAAIDSALRGGVDIFELWAAGQDLSSAHSFGEAALSLCRRRGIPFLVNNDLKLARLLGADGVHFDELGVEPSQVKSVIGARPIVGYTIDNDPEKAFKAQAMGADYISFCSIFPTTSVLECEIVPLETVARIRHRIKIPVFASGGITLENLSLVLEAGVDGVAVSSAVLRAGDPEKAARGFKQVIEGRLKTATAPGS